MKSIVQEVEAMNRTNVSLTSKQLERLHARAQHEGVFMAELIRRGVDVFLVWDASTYMPIHPRSKETGLSTQLSVTFL